jgi:hypothetical protein
VLGTAELIRCEDNGMSHEIAKLLLEHAESFLERTEAIKSAMSLGMPLAEIEEYLDWLDTIRGKRPPQPPVDPPSDQSR